MSIYTDFLQAADLSDWAPINDGVMGGLSESSMRADAAGVASFEGKVSLENQGGFASVRRSLRQIPPESARLLRLHVLGDGHIYKFTLRTDGGFDGISYQAEFTPASHQWMDIDLALEQFSAVFRGRPVDAPALVSGSQVRQIGLMIANRQAGAFCLKLRSIRFI